MEQIIKDARLSGRVAVVTGAGSRAAGIGNGRAAAILMARSGAKIALLDAVAEWAVETGRMIAEEGGTAMVVEADVTQSAACAEAVSKSVAEWGASFVQAG